jgi:site-specific DNA-methyltransferase (adenine-specific)
MAKKAIPQFLLLPIDEIELLEDNPRDISDKEFKALCNDIRKDPHFLMQRPPLVNFLTKEKRKVAYAGNQRIKAAKQNGLTQIHVWVENDVPKKLQEERMLKDNLHRGEWNIDLLKKYDTSFLLNVGFNADSLNGWFKDFLTTTEDNFDVDAEVAKILKPKSKPGQLFQLGDHKLLCGDSTKPDDVKHLMGTETATVIYCDPPYNIGLSYDKGIKGNSTKKTYTDKKFKDNKKPADYLEWLKLTITNAKSVCPNGAHIFYWCDPKFIGIIQTAFEQTKVKNKSVCFWIKNHFNPVTQMAFNRITEPCVYGTFGRPYLSSSLNNLNELLNREIDSKAVHDTIFGMVDIWLSKRDKTNDYVHPTQKPVTLHEKPLKRCSAPGNIVIDLFGGSGSTLISCEQLKRKARLIEQDPVFCDVIIKRWEKLTGKKATLINGNREKK